MTTGLARKVDNCRLGGGLRHLDGALVGAAFDKHAGRRVAGLAGVGETEAGAARHGRVDIGIGKHKVRRFAAKLQRHGLHRIGGGLADQDAGTGGAGEGNNVDFGMRGQDAADSGTIAIDHVVDTCGNPGFVNDLAEQDARHRRHLGRLQHHGAPGRQRRADFQNHLVHRPVPRRDQRRHTGRLIAHFLPFHTGAKRALPLECVKGADEGFQMTASGTRLVGKRHVDRRPHLGRDRLGHVLCPLLINGKNGAENLSALCRRCHRPGGKGTACRRNGRLGIRRTAKRNGGEGFFRCRVVDRKVGTVTRGDPGAVDVEIARFDHFGASLQSRLSGSGSGCRPVPFRKIDTAEHHDNRQSVKSI